MGKECENYSQNRLKTKNSHINLYPVNKHFNIQNAKLVKKLKKAKKKIEFYGAIHMLCQLFDLTIFEDGKIQDVRLFINECTSPQTYKNINNIALKRQQTEWPV